MSLRRLFAALFFVAPLTALQAQEVDEPPIPVMIVCPYHEDSLRRAYEAELMSGNERQADSVSFGAIKAAEAMSAQMERSFTYLYLILGLLALTSIAALRVAYRLRNELHDLRQEHHAPALSLPAPIVVDTTPFRSPRKTAFKPKTSRRTAKSPRRLRRPRSTR